MGKRPDIFVPPPLPPIIGYEGELVRALAEANRFLGELAGLARQLPDPGLLIRPFLGREAVLSSRIEGTQADLKDLYAYQARQETLPGLEAPTRETKEADVREVFNYLQALEYGIRRLDEQFPVSLRLIRELHERLMHGVRGEGRDPGEFRRIQNWIGPSSRREDATYVPPPPQEVMPCLGALETYLHSEDLEHPPLVRLALVHYQFEAIHPFLDGNGRIGRLLIVLLLVDWGLLPIPLLYLSAYFERHREQYYDLLRGVSEDEDWESWVLFFLRGISLQAQEASRLAKRLQDLQANWRERLSEPGASISAVKLADSLLEQPVITIPQAAQTLEVTYPTAKVNVEKLVEAGVLVRAPGTSHPKVFWAPEILRLTELEDAEVAEPTGETQRTQAEEPEST